MNENTVTQLKIIVERTVRPVRASTLRKRKMREELLAHVSDVFEEESAQNADERIALEQVALRFGSPAEVTSQLQESVPSSDAVRRYWEGQPGEPAWRTAIRFAWVSGTFSLALTVIFVSVGSFTEGGIGTWPGEALILCLHPVLAIPVWLSGLVFLTNWMENALCGSAGRSRLKVAVVAAGSCLFMALWLAAVSWPIWSARPDYLIEVMIVGCCLGAPGFTYALAQPAHLRRRYHEEWACLDIS
jgi:hypothetical protein